MAPADRPPVPERSGGQPGQRAAATDMPPPWLRRGSAPVIPPADDDQEIWLLSYSDMVTLLFAVFVMLLAITTLKDQLPKEPAPAAAATARTEPAPPQPPQPPQYEEEREEPPPSLPPPRQPPDPRPHLNPGEVAVESPSSIGERWRDRVTALGLPEGVAVKVQQNRVAIEIGDAILFASGQAELSKEGQALLGRLVPLVSAMPGELLVEGHTDSIPIASARFPSNWELSAARAAAVVRMLVEAGIAPGRMAAVGYADTKPLAAGSDPASLARNRRVTLSIQAVEGPKDTLAPPAAPAAAGSPP